MTERNLYKGYMGDGSTLENFYNSKELREKVSKKQTPHNEKIYSSILEHIGHTPIIKCDRLAAKHNLKCTLLAKCEYFNPGGSIKDRIAIRMIEEAEKKGVLKPGATIIEPTSGNTGLGIALAAAIKGYKCIICMPDKMSREKADVLAALGAEVFRTPTSAAPDSPESHFGVAIRLNREIPNSIVLDQYNNIFNPMAHYDETAEEIVFQTDKKVTVAVIGTGTGGTATGTALKLKEKIPNIKIVGVDPVGSILARPESLNSGILPYMVEGIGYEFSPNTLNHNVIDEWVKVNDKESFYTVHELIQLEGILCGGSSGSNMHGAIQVAKNLKEDDVCLVILPDGIRNYMTKFCNPDWMKTNNFEIPKPPMSNNNVSTKKNTTEIKDDKNNYESNCKCLDKNNTCCNNNNNNNNICSFCESCLCRIKTVGDLNLNKVSSILDTELCAKAVETMTNNSFDCVPVVNFKEEIVGMVTMGNFVTSFVHRRVNLESTPVSKVMLPYSNTCGIKVTKDTLITEALEVLKKQSTIFVFEKDNTTKITNVLTKFDLYDYFLDLKK